VDDVVCAILHREDKNDGGVLVVGGFRSQSCRMMFRRCCEGSWSESRHWRNGIIMLYRETYYDYVPYYWERYTRKGFPACTLGARPAHSRLTLRVSSPSAEIQPGIARCRCRPLRTPVGRCRPGPNELYPL
jgi:hypothetical protein